MAPPFWVGTSRCDVPARVQRAEPTRAKVAHYPSSTVAPNLPPRQRQLKEPSGLFCFLVRAFRVGQSRCDGPARVQRAEPTSARVAHYPSSTVVPDPPPRQRQLKGPSARHIDSPGRSESPSAGPGKASPNTKSFSHAVRRALASILAIVLPQKFYAALMCFKRFYRVCSFGISSSKSQIFAIFSHLHIFLVYNQHVTK